MNRPLFHSYEAQARHDAQDCNLPDDAVRIMELIGQIADGDTYSGPVDTKIQLIAMKLRRLVEDAIMAATKATT